MRIFITIILSVVGSLYAIGVHEEPKGYLVGVIIGALVKSLYNDGE